MGGHVAVPWLIRWIAAVLFAIPAPTAPWAAIIGHLAWPAVTVFLITRYRRFLRLYLMILAERFRTDHVKLGPFEMRRHDPVISLDPKQPADSTLNYDSEDINRIERMFAFIADDQGFNLLHGWLAREIGTEVDFDDFLTAPRYATERQRAFDEVEGLAR